MRVLLVAYYYPPLNTGGTIRPQKMAQYLPPLGHPVCVLTHTYGQTDLSNGPVLRVKDTSYNRERQGLKYWQWLCLRVYTEIKNLLGRYHSIYSWWQEGVVRQAEQIMAIARPEVIIATYPPVETLQIGLYLSKRFGLPLVCDFRDGLLFEPIEQKRMNRYACIRERYAAIEAGAAAASAAVITIAGPIGDYFRKKYGVKRVEVMATGFDRQDFAGVSGQVCLDPAYFQVVFTGRFALSHEYNPVGFFFTAVRDLLEEQPALARKLKLHLLGEYRAGELARLKDLIGEGIIEVHGFVPRRLALAFQRAADVLLIITPSDRTSATSAKIFEYLATGKPILALTDGTVLAEIIRETGAGWLAHPEKPAEIKDMLGRLLSDRQFLLSLKPDRQAIERYSTASQMAKLGRLLDEISTERR